MLEIEKTVYIPIYTEDIIEEGNLTSSSDWAEIKEAVEDYVLGLDDCDYFLLDNNDIITICNTVNNEIHSKD